MADEWTFQVETGARPLTMNSERSRHWAPGAEAIAEWRKAAGWAATAAGIHKIRLDRAMFEFMPVYKTGPFPDTGSIFPTEKAIVDALIDLDLIPDDNRFHNAGQMSLPPQGARFTGVVVRVSACPPHLNHSCCVCRAARLRSQAVNDARARRRR